MGWMDGDFDPRKSCGNVVVVGDGEKSTSTRRSATIYSGWFTGLDAKKTPSIPLCPSARHDDFKATTVRITAAKTQTEMESTALPGTVSTVKRGGGERHSCPSSLNRLRCCRQRGYMYEMV